MKNSHLVEWFASAGPVPRIAFGISQSGTGKSTEVAYLRSLNYAAFDLDNYALNAWHSDERNDRWSIQPMMLRGIMHGSIIFGQASNVVEAIRYLSDRFEIGFFWFTRPVETLVSMLSRRIGFDPKGWVAKAVTAENQATYSGMRFLEKYGASVLIDEFAATFLGYYLLPARAPFDEDSHSSASSESIGFPLWCTPKWTSVKLSAGPHPMPAEWNHRTCARSSDTCWLLEALAGEFHMHNFVNPMTLFFSSEMTDMGRMGSFVSWGKQPMSITLDHSDGGFSVYTPDKKVKVPPIRSGFSLRIPVAEFRNHGVPIESPLLEYQYMNDTALLTHYSALSASFKALEEQATKTASNGK